MNKANVGFLSTVMAFTIWGCLTAYWNWLRHIDMFTVLSHRAVWLATFVFVTLWFQGRLGEVAAIFADRKTLVRIMISGIMIALNWLFFYYSVQAERVLEGSLGEYISPIMTIMLGSIILREKLSWPQCISVGLLCLAISNNILALNMFPWLPLAIGGSFALYGLFRRGVTAKPLPSLLVETLTVLPLAIGYLYYRNATGHDIFDGADTKTMCFLVGSGIATGLPALFFALGAPRVRMTTIGIIQYLTPTLSFIFGILLYKEPLTTKSAFTFALIWAAIIIYSIDNIRRQRKLHKHHLGPTPART